jgi:hypothetical protein
MRRAPGVGDRRPGCDAGRAQPLNHGGEHRFLTAMKVIGTRRIDDDTVRRIGRRD